ncbi:Putative protein of unknown function [Podospora comata]|uniref:Uncharacterized protein n=1 Tax=Podospora comata TaxID=48703 RepID=A0ABY6RZE4_PODCO|nr:Putative protein of unknown function [Podospora comata]
MIIAGPPTLLHFSIASPARTSARSGGIDTLSFYIKPRPGRSSSLSVHQYHRTSHPRAS